jgi:ribose-phosphate pyrophosphokinase
MKIIPGPASKELGERIAHLLKVESISVTSKSFPDGESYVRLEGSPEDEEVVIVQTTSPYQNTRIVELALLADAAKRNGARKVTAVAPYLAYARQDKMFLEGEPLSIELVAKMLKTAGVDKMLTVNVHQAQALNRFPFPASQLSAIPLLAQYFKTKGYEKAFALAPDKGAVHIAEEAGKILDGGHGHLEKQRDRYTGKVNIEKQELNVRGETVIVFDDIISSGGTIVEAAKMLRQLGAKHVLVACVHPLMIGDAEKKILDAGVEEIVGTDSVPSNVSKVSLAPLIAEHLSG